MDMNFRTLTERITDDEAAYEFLELLRWDGQPLCPHCGSTEQHYFLTPKAADGRKTRTGAVTVRRLWKCRSCRKQFSVLTGTIMHGTKISIRTWVLVIYSMCSSKNGVASREIERDYGLTPRSAWFMIQRIREAMLREDDLPFLAGEVESDETWIGPRQRNVHRNHYANKTPVLTLIDRGTGEARSGLMPRVTAETLAAALTEQMAPEAVLMTDGNRGYQTVGATFSEHHRVNHEIKEYARTVRGKDKQKRRAGVNRCEGFFSQLKGSLDGTFHHVSVEHLNRYLAEFDYRYSTRKQSDAQRMANLVGRVGGRRITYDALTGR
ncbi:MAG: IS1595 family transposase [Acidobacteria bacterium]|nr:IS1595 family transposase [Acidobacteriota bacterium]